MGTRDAYTGLEVAVIGMAGRFPGASSVDELWSNLLAGVESISRFTPAELRSAGVDEALLANPAYVPAAGVVEGADLFDATFFGYSPREAALIDPQQRVFLETAWAAMEHAGYAPGSVDAVVGVYGGVGWSDYARQGVRAGSGHELDHQAVVANDKDFAATRVSYKLNLHGPSLTVQTACSTSLVAVHLACQGLIAGECEMALAGGFTIRARQRTGYLYEEEGIASPDGHCRAFSALAQGCVPGNGGAVVVLKPLARAIEDRDTVHAVIRGSAINNDGARKVGYTAPSSEGQTGVIRAALGVAGVSPDRVGYLEAHGTGTIIGDPIEVEAAGRAFTRPRLGYPSCMVGSVKSNVGHLDAGAGVTGFIKAALAVRDGRIPPSLYCQPPNPRIDFANSPFGVSASASPWPLADGPRVAGVSAFGIGGTNAHVVIEQPPDVPVAGRADGPELIVVSAKSLDVLDRSSLDLAAHLLKPDAPRLADVAHTLRQGRTPLPFRRAIVASSATAAADLLRAAAGSAAVSCDEPPRIIFAFPGQGSQYVGMAGGLYDAYPEFRASFDRCADAVRVRGGFDLHDFLTSVPGDTLADRLRETRAAQPAIFSVSYSLAQLVIGWGIRPAGMIGHSLGEYVAACLAGVMTLDDAVALIADRGALLSSLPRGAMAAVSASPERLEPFLSPQLAIAAINASDQCVVSGEHAAVASCLERLSQRGIEGRLLPTSHAFHSPMVEGVAQAWAARVAEVPLQPPNMPYASNLTGSWITAAEATDPGYYGRHLRHTVRFSDNLMLAGAAPHTILLELGPGQTLTGLARRHARATSLALAAVASTRHVDAAAPDPDVLLAAIGQLWTAGATVDWARLPSPPDVRRVPLPTYPFRRDRHWLEAPSGPADDAPAAKRELSEWFSVPSWERLSPAGPLPGSLADHGEAWVVILDTYGVGMGLAALLRERGAVVLTVGFTGTVTGGAVDVTLRADDSSGYAHVLSAMRARGRDRLRFVHCRSLDAEPVEAGTDAVRDAQQRGFESLLALAQAVGDQAWVSTWRLAVVTNQLVEVVGGERVRPEKATLLGPCRTIPLEYAGAETVVIDLGPSAVANPRPAALQALLAMLHTERQIETVALRGAYPWRYGQAPVHLGPSSGSAFQAGGTYVITGGRGGVGLALAEYVARRVRANLILVGRSPFPPRDEWDGVLARGASSVIDEQLARTALQEVGQAARGVSQEPRMRPPSRSAESRRALDALCTVYAARFFSQSGLDWTELWQFDRAALGERCGVLPRFQRYVDALAQMVVDDGLAAAERQTLASLPGRTLPDLPEARARARELNPSLLPVLDLLDACAERLHEALSGAVPAVELLFGEDTYEPFQEAVRAVREQSWTPVCERLAGVAVSALVSADRSSPIRFLEIGGGEGVLTRALLPHLRDRAVEYTFTDIGRSFVLNAQRRAASEGDLFMRFDQLDISQPPTEQGFPSGSVDVVLAFNVMHATPSVVTSVTHARSLLAPGGMLILQESVRPERWVDLIWGLTDGWWAFDDGLRHRSPLLRADQWVSVLREAGFTDVAVQPAGGGDDPDTVLIVGVAPRSAAQSATDPMTEALAALRRIEALGSVVEIVTADVADEAAMRKIVADAERRFGGVNGVVHAALQLHDGAIQHKTADAVADVFRAKVDGTLALKAALAGRPIDFFVMFSSLVSTISGAGQVDYCAASNFQDAFAFAERGKLAARVLSVDWAAWGDVGKALRSALERGASPGRAFSHGMSSAEGFEALERALASGTSQILVSPEELRAIERRRSLEASPASPEGVAAPGVDQEVPTEDALSDVERVIAGIWSEVLGVPRVAASDNFFDLGGDSVISLQFIARAKKAGIRLTSRQVFELQTVAALADAAAQAAPSAGGGGRA